MTEKKTNLHERNKHNMGYDFKLLIKTSPELSPFIIPNKYGNQSIDFSNPQAVLMLNKSLLKHHYKIDHWNIPEGYLCPPIPGRSDYIHYLADLLASSNNNVQPKGKKIKCLDIGVGANCIYPLIGNKEYNWSFVGSDIDKTAVKSANQIIESNNLEKNLAVNPRVIFSQNIITNDILKNLHIDKSPTITKDCDGYYFVNYLNVLNHTPPICGKSIRISSYNNAKKIIDLTIKNHKNIIIENIEKHKYSVNILAKYLWLKEYHNRYINENLSSDLLIK